MSDGPKHTLARWALPPLSFVLCLSAVGLTIVAAVRVGLEPEVSAAVPVLLAFGGACCLFTAITSLIAWFELLRRTRRDPA